MDQSTGIPSSSHRSSESYAPRPRISVRASLTDDCLDMSRPGVRSQARNLRQTSSASSSSLRSSSVMSSSRSWHTSCRTRSSLCGKREPRLAREAWCVCLPDMLCTGRDSLRQPEKLCALNCVRVQRIAPRDSASRSHVSLYRPKSRRLVRARTCTSR